MVSFSQFYIMYIQCIKKSLPVLHNAGLNYDKQYLNRIKVECPKLFSFKNSHIFGSDAKENFRQRFMYFINLQWKEQGYK